MTEPEDYYGGAPYDEFSAGYVLARDIEVRRWSDDLAGMPDDLYRLLVHVMGEPIIGYTGGIHYEFRPMQGIPNGTAAVPRHNHDEEPRALLLAR